MITKKKPLEWFRDRRQWNWRHQSKDSGTVILNRHERWVSRMSG